MVRQDSWQGDACRLTGLAPHLGIDLGKLFLERGCARRLRRSLLPRGFALGQQRGVLLAQAAVGFDLGRQALLLRSQILNLLCTSPTSRS